MRSKSVKSVSSLWFRLRFLCISYLSWFASVVLRRLDLGAGAGNSWAHMISTKIVLVGAALVAGVLVVAGVSTVRILGRHRRLRTRQRRLLPAPGTGQPSALPPGILRST